jgi:hypothetical protein
VAVRVVVVVVEVVFSIEVFCVSVLAAAARAAEVEDEQEDGIGSMSFISVKVSRFLEELVNVEGDAEERDDAAGDWLDVSDEVMLIEGLLTAKEAPIVRVDEQSVI